MTVEKERNLWEQGDNLRQVPENHGRAVIKKTASWLVIHNQWVPDPNDKKLYTSDLKFIV